MVANTEAVRDAFRKLEGCMNRVSQIGTRIGDRLQASRGYLVGSSSRIQGLISPECGIMAWTRGERQGSS